jgi:PhnB protein
MSWRQIEIMMTHGDSPIADQVSADWRAKIIHARLIVGDQVLLASDSPAEHYENACRSIWHSLDD